MRIIGTIPDKPETFEKLLQDLCKRQTTQSRQLLRTAQVFKFFSNDMLLTELTRQEQLQLDKLHWDALVTDSKYEQSSALDLRMILPKYLSRRVDEAKYAGGNETHQLVALLGKESKVFVEAKPFLTLLQRHPNAAWRFTYGEEYWKHPVVLLQRDGFQEGRLLGLLPVVPLRLEKEQYVGGPKLRKRVRRGRQRFYAKIVQGGSNHVGSESQAG